MGVRQDLRRARQRPDLADRVRVEVVKEKGAVRQARTSGLVPTPTSGSTADIPFINAEQSPERVALRRRVGADWQEVTARAFADEVAATAKGLVAAGLEPGGRVALMSRTRYEWAVLDFAIWTAGGQTVPVYATSSVDQIEWILRDSDARLVITESPQNEASVRQAVEKLPSPRRLWQLEDGGMGELAAAEEEVSDQELDRRRSALAPDTVATVCYTSGTTGRPKGCVLTHANLLAEAGNTIELLHPVFRAATRQEASTLLFLPLAHILGRTIQIACLKAGIGIGHCPSIKPNELRPQIRSFKPTFLVGVPYLFEKIHEAGRATAEKMGRGASFDRADRIGVRFGEASLEKDLGTGKGPGFGLRLAAGLYDLLVYRRIRKELGGRLSYAISGGSPLDRRLSLFFYAAGVVIYEGYGLTETTAAATLTPPLSPRPGTVGQPVPGTAIRIADDGEVLVKGDIVFGAYWKNETATQEVLRDGWFTTGDLGSLDEDGYLRITGRKKDILVTSGGKNVSPAVLEDRMRSRPPVGQCLVLGDGRSHVTALVTLEPEAVRHWLAVRKRSVHTPLSELREDSEIREAVQEAVDYANEAVSTAESIRGFRIVDGEFTEENGLLTPSMKVKRAAVLKHFADEVSALYER